jgi:predicted dienelactone hydrolase
MRQEMSARGFRTGRHAPFLALAALLGMATPIVGRAQARRDTSDRVDRASPPPARALDNRIDVVTPFAPALAEFGVHAVGVRTITVIDPNRPDILRTKAGDSTVRRDRSLTVEVWYPAQAATTVGRGEYRAIMRDPSVTVTLYGRAHRDATPLAGERPFPLVIISHGYPGNRYLLSHLGENLASKGYLVASIDHTESTYDNAQAFGSTLYHRPYDQLFVLNELARLGAAGSGSFLSGHVDASRTGIIGYSMGGYGVINVIGGGFREAAATLPGAPANRLLAERSATNPTYRASVADARIRAAVAIGPWGMPAGYWDSTGLAGIRTPTLFVAGSADEVSGYETGTRAIFKGAVNAERYLLTFVGAGHNAGAPIPAPIESYAYSDALKSYPFTHYADPIWDTRRMNNILAHFVTAHLDAQLKGDSTMLAYLHVTANGKDGVYAMDRQGKPLGTHTYWKGFKRGTAAGLTMERQLSRQP